MARRALKLCSCTRCTTHSGTCTEMVSSGRCDGCARVADRARGRRQDRGYDAGHDRLRQWWRPKVERVEVDCHEVVCLMPIRRILPGQEWHLCHDRETGRYRGPGHAKCNTSEGGRESHAL